MTLKSQHLAIILASDSAAAGQKPPSTHIRERDGEGVGVGGGQRRTRQMQDVCKR